MTRLPRSASVLQAAGRFGVEELPLVDADDFGVVVDPRDAARRSLLTFSRGDAHVAVRHDVVVAEAVVDRAA